MLVIPEEHWAKALKLLYACLLYTSYGPPAPGSKVGDFIQTWLMGSWNCGVFTHREIAQRLMDTFTGLQIKELEWFENPREKTLKNGKPRARQAKWLPEREVDLVYLCLLYTSRCV